MDSSSDYPDLMEPGLRKKKRKKMERGEISFYDRNQSDKSQNVADREYSRMTMKKAGVKWGKKD